MNTATFCRELQNRLDADSMPTAEFCRCFCGVQRQNPVLTAMTKLMGRIEDAAKNQTPRIPESTVLDLLATSGRREEEEERDGES